MPHEDQASVEKKEKSVRDRKLAWEIFFIGLIGFFVMWILCILIGIAYFFTVKWLFGERHIIALWTFIIGGFFLSLIKIIRSVGR